MTPETIDTGRTLGRDLPTEELDSIRLDSMEDVVKGFLFFP